MAEKVKRVKKFDFPVNTMVGSVYSNFRNTPALISVDKEFRSRYYMTKFISAILNVPGKIEEWRFRKKIREFEIKEAPIFIIGFWRSGTTVLHNLLSQNPDFGYVSLFHGIFPHLCLMNQGWVQKIAKLLLPDYRPFDKVKLDFDHPQEEEIALGNMQSLSFYNFFFYPSNFQYYLRHGLLFEDVSEKEIQNWKDAYLKLVKTALINTGGKRFVSKNPPHTVRIKLLLEMFPDAKFIYTHRNTYQSIYSFQQFIIAVHEGITLQHYDRELHTLNLIRLYKVIIEEYEIQKKLIPPGQLIEVKFEEFEKDILGSIRNIYDTLGIPGFEKALPYMEKFNATISNFSRKDHRLDPSFMQLIDRELGPLIEL